MLLAVSNREDDAQQINLDADAKQHPIMEHAM